MTPYVIPESYDVAPLWPIMEYLNHMMWLFYDPLCNPWIIWCGSSMTYYVIHESYDVAPLWPLM